MNKVYLLLGSNIGDSLEKLNQASLLIENKLGHIINQSSIYKSEAWGITNQSDFYNQVIVVNTTLTSFKILKTILSIEKKMGRVRTVKNAPRVIDIDMLFFNKEIIHTKTLQIPHPLLQQRNFVLIPLNQIAPQLQHPLLKTSIHQLLKICSDTLGVKKIKHKFT